MKRSVAFAFVVLLLLGFGTTNAFAQWTLGDSSANVNGNTENPFYSSSVNFGIGPGTLTYSVSRPGSNYVGVYLNPYFDSGYGDTSGAWGSTHGSAPAGLSYQFGWPGGESPTVFDNFAANALNGLNTVPAYVAPPNACCSVALAEILGFNVAPGSHETITFTTYTQLPAGFDGFYLQVTDHDSGNSIYLTEQASSSSAVTPEPGSMLLMASGLGLIMGRCRRFFERRNSA